MPRSLIVTFDDDYRYQYNQVPQNVTEDDVKVRVKKDFPDKKLVSIEEFENTTPALATKTDGQINKIAQAIYDEIDAFIWTNDKVIKQKVNEIKTLDDWNKLKAAYKKIAIENDEDIEDQDLLKVLDLKKDYKTFLINLSNAELKDSSEPTDFDSAQDLIKMLLTKFQPEELSIILSANLYKKMKELTFTKR